MAFANQKVLPKGTTAANDPNLSLCRLPHQSRFILATTPTLTFLLPKADIDVVRPVKDLRTRPGYGDTGNENM